MSSKSKEIVPQGVDLRDPEDFDTLRTSLFSSVKDAFQSKFPHTYGGVRMEVENLDYENPKDYDLKDQKNALLKNRFLSWRLRGDLKLYDDKTNELLDEKRTTLMRVPYVTERGTSIHNGNEYVTLTQARLLPGVYTRRRGTGEIESHFNPRRSTGRAFRVRLEPESQLYKLAVGQASLRLYSLLHDLGVSDEELESRWGRDILEANKASYDSKVFDKAYMRFVPKGDPMASREEKASAIKEALGMTKFDSKVTSQTLPNLGNRKIAATWMAKAAMMQPMQMPQMNANPDVYSQFGQGNPELANQPVATTQEEYIKFEQQKQKEKQKQEEKHMKARMQIDALRGKMPPPGPDRDAVEKELVSGQLAIRKAKQQAQTKRINQSVKIDTQEKARQIKEESEAEIKQIQDQVDMQNQERDYHKTREDEHVNHEKQKQTILQQQQLKQEAEQRKMQMQQELETLKMQGDPTYGMQQEGMQQDMDPMQAEKFASMIPDMLEAKEYSDKGQYPPKHNIMRKLIEQSPSAFRYTEEEGTTPGMRGIEHIESGFRMHLPKDLFGGLANGGPNGIRVFSGPRPSTEDNRKAFDAKYGPGAYDKIQPRQFASSNPKHPLYDNKFKPDWDSVKKDTVMYKESARKNVRVIENGQMIDVDELYKMTEGREYMDVPLDTVAGYGTRSKRDRYGPMRYERADPEKPGLIDERGFIIDGRHRYFKNKDIGNDTQKFIQVSDEEIGKSYIDGSHPDYDTSRKIKI